MPALDPHALATMLLTAGALFLFTRERFLLHLSSLAVLLVLVAGFELFPYSRNGQPLGAADFLAGFGKEVLITIVLLLRLAARVSVSLARLANLVDTARIRATGAPEPIGRGVKREVGEPHAAKPALPPQR